VIEFGSENYGTQSALQTYLRTVDEFDLRIVTLLWIHQTQHWIPFFRQRKWLGTWSELITEAIQDHGDKNYSDLFGDRPSGAVRPAILAANSGSGYELMSIRGNDPLILHAALPL
jgi:hypothetical protein